MIKNKNNDGIIAKWKEKSTEKKEKWPFLF